jgi:glycosyltransferase involved in cell wall biosynthesis
MKVAPKPKTSLTEEVAPPRSAEKRRFTVALLQRYVAHYRLPLFQKLHHESEFNWEFFFDDHVGIDWSGLPPASYGDLHIHPIKNRELLGGLTYQTGFKIRRSKHAAIMLDLGWTLISNPKYLLEAKLKGVRRIGWSKGIPQIERSKSKARLAYERFIINQCDALVAYGQMSKEYFRQLGYPPNRIFVAQNTIDTTRIIRERPRAVQNGDELRERLGLRNRTVIGYLGKVAPFKQVDRIVDAFNHARKGGMDAVLLVAGNGSSRPAIEAQIAASDYKDDIRFVADVPVGAEAGYFQLFDLYVSFSQGGLGILEAMAHGRTVLSTPERYPETELLANNETALVSDDMSVEAFARRMAEAIGNPALRAEVARGAEACVAREATQEVMVEAIDRAVERTLMD